VPSNGVRPVSSSKPSDAERVEIDRRRSAPPPRADSGATYSTVPASSQFALPPIADRQAEVEQHDPVVVVTTTLVGLTSRCTTPARCSAASAPASWPTAAGPARGDRPGGPRLATPTPSTSSIEKHSEPSCSNSSPRRTRLGWRTAAARRNSRLIAIEGERASDRGRP
jgi:hypothetical protein